MRATSMITLAELLREVRDLSSVQKFPGYGSRMQRTVDAQRVEALWGDIAQLLDDERQSQVARFDAWLQKIDDQLTESGGGDTAKLIEIGLKVADRRAQVLKLDARTEVGPAVDPRTVEAIVASQFDDEGNEMPPPQMPPPPPSASGFVSELPSMDESER